METLHGALMGCTALPRQGSALLQHHDGEEQYLPLVSARALHQHSGMLHACPQRHAASIRWSASWHVNVSAAGCLREYCGVAAGRQQSASHAPPQEPGHAAAQGLQPPVCPCCFVASWCHHTRLPATQPCLLSQFVWNSGLLLLMVHCNLHLQKHSDLVCVRQFLYAPGRGQTG